MVRANRPWRLVTGLSKVLVGAFATGAIALATNTIWLFADTMGPWRMSAATVLSIVAMILWLILDHELWERPKSPEERDRSVLYNTATVVTLVIGVVVLHVALFGLLLFTACLTLPPELLSRILGHGVNFFDYLTLTWLLASIATIGGALGSGLEDDAAVKEAAYGVRQRQRLEETRQPSNEAG
ncbi:putative membrane protein [Rhodococcus opacus]|nr:putative membrane protein [Rhodococcus opacus]